MSTKMYIAGGALILLGLGVAGPGYAARGTKAPEAATTRAEQPLLTELRAENSPSPRLVLRTSGNPAYSAYSPQPDVYVIDLAQTSKASELTTPSNLPSVVASMSVDQAIELGRPLTRVTLRFARAYAPTTTTDAGGLVVSFPEEEKNAPAMAAAVAPPVEAAPAPAASSVDVAAVMQDLPKIEAPVPTPAKVATETARPSATVEPARNVVSGKRATVLNGVTTSGSGADLRIALQTNGQAEYTTFKLSNPLRLVVDLKGVRMGAGAKGVNVGNPIVRAVRVSQFKPMPQPVTRVVFDLDELVETKIDVTDGAVQVAFADAAQPADGALAVASAPTPVEVEKPVVVAEAKSTQTKKNKADDVFAGAPVTENQKPVEIASVPDVPVIAPKKAYQREVVNSATPSPGPQSTTTTPKPTGTTAPVTSSVRTTQPENVFTDSTSTSTSTTSTTTAMTTLAGGATGQSRTLTSNEKVYTGEPLDLNLKEADIKDVLRTFAQLTGLNIAIDPGVEGRVTVEFNDVPWDQALELILKQNGLTFVLQGNVMRIGTIGRLAAESEQIRKLEEDAELNVPLQTIIKHLSYAKAGSVQNLLQKMASRRGAIDFDARTNQIIITEIPSYLATMLNLIETVDIPTPQVVIEARVVETTKTFSRQLGIALGANANFDPSLGTGTGLVFPNRILASTGSGLNFAGPGPILNLTLANVLGTFDLDILLTAAENEGLARIVSAPKVTTQDNQAAEIQSGVQIPIQTRVNQTTTVSYVDATLRLSVTPQITAEGTVIMDITVQKTEPLSGINVVGGNNAPLSTRRATTKLMVRDGGTTVIGGIYQATENRSQSRLPFVSDIPIIGNLFKNNNFDSRHDELLIFITPRIVRA